MSNQRSRYWPTSPRRPNENNSATPPTTGGSTIGRIANARTIALPAELDRASSHAIGRPNSTERAGRRDRALERQPERGRASRRGEDRPGCDHGARCDESGERRDEEHEQADDREGDDERRRADTGRTPAPAHGARKPYCCCSVCSLALDVTKSTHALASAAFLEPFNAAIGSVATTFWPVGIATPSTLLAGALHVGDVHERGVGVAGLHLREGRLRVELTRLRCEGDTCPASASWSAYLPHGASDAQSTTISPGLVRSATGARCARVALADCDLHLVLGEHRRRGRHIARALELRHVLLIGRGEHVGRARRSGSARTSVEELSKSKLTLVPGCAASNCVAERGEPGRERRRREHVDRSRRRTDPVVRRGRSTPAGFELLPHAPSVSADGHREHQRRVGVRRIRIVRAPWCGASSQAETSGGRVRRGTRGTAGAPRPIRPASGRRRRRGRSADALQAREHRCERLELRPCELGRGRAQLELRAGTRCACRAGAKPAAATTPSEARRPFGVARQIVRGGPDPGSEPRGFDERRTLASASSAR